MTCHQSCHYAPSSHRQKPSFLWAGMLCPVEWRPTNSTSFQVRLHDRRRRGHHLITLHNKAQHQGFLLNWDKWNGVCSCCEADRLLKRHLAGTVPRAQLQDGCQGTPESSMWGSQAHHLGTIRYRGTLFTQGDWTTKGVQMFSVWMCLCIYLLDGKQVGEENYCFFSPIKFLS